jgi:hypothetical protein
MTAIDTGTVAACIAVEVVNSGRAFQARPQAAFLALMQHDVQPRLPTTLAACYVLWNLHYPDSDAHHNRPAEISWAAQHRGHQPQPQSESDTAALVS